MGKTVFITGASGFIGSNLAKRILTTEPDTKVIGLDNMNDYYDVRIKEARLAELQKFENYTFIKGNLADKALINSIFEQYHPDIVVNLGAQAGVRYSITNPDAYIESNMIGFYNILEACRHYQWSIWCMHLPALSTAATRRCPTPPMTRWTIRFLCMRLPRSPTS